ncbi:fungal-specific transcription factor domain-containing protein [Chaetomium sp. MPI-CAGE-AT-0009]|nr:fungal-specific transcription factor domain-containing protein [Chaetomium sp. MPI-CAGE-AT-0009]
MPSIDYSSGWEYDFSIMDWMPGADREWLDMVLPPAPPSLPGSGSPLSHELPDTSQNALPRGEASNSAPIDGQEQGMAGKAVQWPADWDPTRLDNVIYFPDMSHVKTDVLDAEDFGHVERISADCYNNISNFMQRHVAGTSHPYQPFHNANVASIQAFDAFVQLYFEYFQPNLPFLHQPTFNPSEAPWQLVLATAAIGCGYSKVCGASQYAIGLQELLRRAIAEAVEKDNSVAREPWILQCIVLNSIGMTYSGNRRMFELSETRRNIPVTMARRNGSLASSSAGRQTVSEDDGTVSSEKSWKEWIVDESKRRLGFAIFLLDINMMMHFGAPSCMRIEELHQPLPVQRTLWEAPNAEEWLKVSVEQNEAPERSFTVASALTALQEGKRLPASVDTFARLILVCAIYHHSSNFQETVHRNPFFWPATNEDYISKHKRDVTKALEALQQHPNYSFTSDIHTHGLLEFTFQCHILLTLMSLHVPRRAILGLASSARNDQDYVRSRARLARWMSEDGGRSARSAVSFAGRILAIVRQTPSHAFHVPTSLLLSILVLWVFNRMHSENIRGRGPPAGLDDRGRGSTIRLDRVGCPGELEIAGASISTEVQAWIDTPSHRRPYLQEVGNLYKPSACLRLLEMGSALLRDLRGWGLGQRLAAGLGELRGRCERLP